MHHSTQKRKLTEHLEGICNVLVKYNLISNCPEFKKHWTDYEYSKGVKGVGIDILYNLLNNNMERIYGIQKNIWQECNGDIQKYLKLHSTVRSNTKKQTLGFGGLSWLMLEKICKNDMEFFEDIKKLLKNF